jgi:DNA-directed RNA polymerase specialized sigma24 family protein
MNLANLLSRHLVTHLAATSDENALAELYQRHHNELVEFIRANYSADESTAHEIVDEVFEVVRDKCGEYDETKPLSVWLRKIAGNTALTHRPQSRHADTTRALSSLPDAEFRAVIYTCCLNLAERDAAELLGVTRQQFRKVFDSAMAKLRSEYRLSA